ncbi:MAG: Fic family protein [Smithella sp.]
MIETRLLARIEHKKTQLDGLRPLPAAAVSRLRDQILVEWIYNSNAIEGSTITLQETRLILETGLTVGGKSLREHFEVINHRDAIDYIEDLVASTEPITPFHVRQIHKLVLSRIDDENAGRYRETMVRIAGAAFTPPESWVVPNLMTEWGEWLLAEEKSSHPVKLAALAHHRLVAIHPFIDGNGRTARLVMNLILMRAGYPPTVIQRINRRQYYRVLDQADAGKPVALVNFVSRAVERSLNLYLEACTPMSAPPLPDAEWISLRDAAEGTPYSQEYLSLLARTGRIEAVKRGRVWYTTRKVVEEYQQSVN